MSRILQWSNNSVQFLSLKMKVMYFCYCCFCNRIIYRSSTNKWCKIIIFWNRFRWTAGQSWQHKQKRKLWDLSGNNNASYRHKIDKKKNFRLHVHGQNFFVLFFYVLKPMIPLYSILVCNVWIYHTTPNNWIYIS